MSGDIDALRSVPRDDVQKLLRRLQLRWKRVRNEPSLIIFAAAFLLMLSATGMRIAWDREALRSTQWKESAVRAIQASTEPRENTRNIGILGPVLATIDEDEQRQAVCGRRDSRSCALAAGIHSRFDILLAAMEDYERCQIKPDSDCPKLLEGRLEREFPDVARVSAWASYLARELEIRKDFQKSGMVDRLKPCYAEPAPGKIDRTLAQCLKDFAFQTDLHFPAHTALMHRSGLQADTPPHSSAYSAAISGLQMPALALSLALSSLQSELDVTPLAEDPRRFDKAYVISSSGGLAIWRGDKANLTEMLPGHRYWAAASYFGGAWDRSFMAANDRITQPYIDLGGRGIVETQCRAIRMGAAAKNPTADVKSELEFVGVVCTDLTLSPRSLLKLLDSLRDNTTIATAAATIARDGRLKKFVPERINVTDGILQSQIYDRMGSETEFFNSVSELKTPGDPLFLIPVQQHISGDTEFIIAQVQSPNMPAQTLIIIGAAVAAAVLALVAWIYGYLASVRSKVELLRRTQLRSLQTGVIETDSQGRIAWLNDRGQELLEIPAHSLAAPGNSSLSFYTRHLVGNIRLQPVVDLMLVPGRGQLANGADQFEKLHPDRVRQQRQNGSTTTYYGRIRGVKTKSATGMLWLEVKAGPMIDASRRGLNADGTFGSLVPVKKDLRLRINRWLKVWMPQESEDLRHPDSRDGQVKSGPYETGASE